MDISNKIASFAVLDLETNTIPDYNFNRASITEIAIHGYSAKDVREGTTCSSPRVNHKLNLVFNPQAVIHPEAEKITGLNNYILEDVSSFDANAANGIVSFLKHLRQPVCLVAHNGDKFDFPVLKQALDKIQVSLPSDVLCIDTLVAIKELDRVAEQKEEVPFSQEEDDSIIPLPDVDNFAVIIPDSQDEEKQPENKEDAASCAIISDSQEEVKTPTDWRKLNETTPKRPPNSLTALRQRKRLIEEKTTPERNKKSRRSLFNMHNQGKPPNQPGTYKLESIYRRLFGESPVVAHHAEADVVSLQKVIFDYGVEFVEYAEANAKLFGDVKKLGTR